MNLKASGRYESSGVALLTALALLFLFSALGIAYVTYMSIEVERSAYDTVRVQARYAAENGFRAALVELDAALRAGQAAGLAGAVRNYEFPVYRGGGSDPSGLQLHEGRQATASVQFADESARINLNHVPPRVLQAILHVDGAAARAIRSSLPVASEDAASAASGPPAANRRWLTAPEDLVSRGYLSAEVYTAVKDDVTVYSVFGQANPAGFININGASLAVLAALLDVPAAAAQTLVARRPFGTLADVAAAAGKDPSMFNIKPDPAAPDALPRELCLSPRAFRIISEGALTGVRVPGGPERTVRSRVEAVVVWDDSGQLRVTYWHESPTGEAAAA